MCKDTTLVNPWQLLKLKSVEQKHGDSFCNCEIIILKIIHSCFFMNQEANIFDNFGSSIKLSVYNAG